MVYNLDYTDLYPIVLLLLSFSFVFGVVSLCRSFHELKKEKKNLRSAQDDLLLFSHYSDVPPAEEYSSQYSSQTISRWTRVCKSRVDSGLSTTPETLEGILFDLSGKPDNGIRFTITSLVILGLLGTFVGMTVALFKASDIITMIKVPSSVVSTEERFEELLTELEPVLGGMKMAFTTSVMGLSLSIILGIAFAIYRTSRTTFRIEAMAFANERLLPIFTPETDLTLGKAVERYSTSMEESLQRIEQTSRATFQEMTNEQELFFQRMAKQLDESARNSAKMVDAFANDVSNQSRLLVKEVADAMRQMAEQVDQSARNNTKMVDVLTNEVSNQNKLLIKEVADATKQLIEASLSGLQEDLQSLYQQMVDDRMQIHSKLQTFLDEATEANISINANNRELIGQIRDQLTTELGEIDNTLREQLSDLIQRLDKFDVPVQRAAERIEVSQKDFAEFMSTAIGDLERQFQTQSDNNRQQLETISQANRAIGDLLAQLAESSGIQSNEIRGLGNSFGSLTEDIASLLTSLSKLQGEFQSLCQHMVDDRKQIHSKFQQSVDEATEASISVNVSNRELLGQIRDQLTAKLGGIDDTLREQLSGFIQRLDRFDAPVQRAAERIEGSQKNFAKFMSRTVGDLQREFERQNDNNERQLEKLTEANQRVGTLLDGLAENSEVQNKNIQDLSGNLSDLTRDVTSLKSSIESLSFNTGSLSQSAGDMNQHVQTLESSMRNSVEEFSNISLAISNLGSLNQSIDAVGQHVQSLEEAAHELAKRAEHQRPLRIHRRRFSFFGKRADDGNVREEGDR